jgi:hypothetical protein
MTATAAKKTAAPAIDNTVPENWEWDVVKEAAAIKVIFDTIGDNFIGQYKGREFIENEPAADGSDRSFWTFNFLGTDGELYTVPESYDLKEKMEDIEINTWTRLEYVRDVKTARNLNPLKSFRVSVRK